MSIPLAETYYYESDITFKLNSINNIAKKLISNDKTLESENDQLID